MKWWRRVTAKRPGRKCRRKKEDIVRGLDIGANAQDMKIVHKKSMHSGRVTRSLGVARAEDFWTMS
jgi:hypothetical protein